MDESLLRGRRHKSWLLAAKTGLRRLRSHVWSGWPEAAYQQPGYRQRLQAVQEHLAQSLDCAPNGPVRIISICAGDGRDIIGVLSSHRRRTDVQAWLIELNHQSVVAGIRQAKNAGLEDRVTFLNTDATLYATYKDIAPAEIILLSGVWGHVPAQERASLAGGLASFCNPRGTLIWTRGVSQGIGRLREIQAHFSAPAWEEERLTLTPDNNWAVASYCHCGPPQELPRSGQVFRFQRRAGRHDAPVHAN